MRGGVDTSGIVGSGEGEGVERARTGTDGLMVSAVEVCYTHGRSYFDLGLLGDPDGLRCRVLVV